MYNYTPYKTIDVITCVSSSLLNHVRTRKITIFLILKTQRSLDILRTAFLNKIIKDALLLTPGCEICTVLRCLQSDLGAVVVVVLWSIMFKLTAMCGESPACVIGFNAFNVMINALQYKPLETSHPRTASVCLWSARLTCTVAWIGPSSVCVALQRWSGVNHKGACKRTTKSILAIILIDDIAPKSPPVILK